MVNKRQSLTVACFCCKDTNSFSNSKKNQTRTSPCLSQLFYGHRRAEMLAGRVFIGEIADVDSLRLSTEEAEIVVFVECRKNLFASLLVDEVKTNHERRNLTLVAYADREG